MADLKFKKGDVVAYRTKDQHGYQAIFAEVFEPDRDDGHVGIKTLPDGTALYIKKKVLTKVQTVWQDSMREVKPHPNPDNEHFACLRAMSNVLNAYQDIEDVFDDEVLTSKQKLKKIKKLNNYIGGVAAKYLPE